MTEFGIGIVCGLGLAVVLAALVLLILSLHKFFKILDKKREMEEDY